MKRYILSFDQGTTSSRAIVFDRNGDIRSIGQKEYRQIFPKPGWVEHDPADILESQLFAAHEALKRARIKADAIEAIGITNQRETTLLWEKATGKPVSNAIVWQCRRTTDICRDLKAAGIEEEIRKKTGLVLDPYFSGTKVMWLLRNIPGLLERAQKGGILFGTVDTWLLWNLTGNHCTDPSNASRTLLYNIRDARWDRDILSEFGIPEQILPSVLPSRGIFGTTRREIFGVPIPVAGIAGDQQAALLGQGCFTKGDAKNTYGTGCFALLNTGKDMIFSKNNLLTTIAWDIGDGVDYAIEGSVFIGGAVVQWLRDQLGVITNAAATEKIAQDTPDTGGVCFVPAFVGLGAPHWNPDVRGTIVGLTRGTETRHLVRAALESIAFQTKDLFTAMEKDMGRPVAALRVDGGASRNNVLMQFQADIMGMTIERPVVSETTALGAAYLAGLTTGIWSGTDDIRKNWKRDAVFAPRMDELTRAKKLKEWERAVRAAIAFNS